MSRYTITRQGGIVTIAIERLIGGPDEYHFDLSSARSLAFAIKGRDQGGSLMVRDRSGGEFTWSGSGKEAEGFAAELHRIASTNAMAEG